MADGGFGLIDAMREAMATAVKRARFESGFRE